MKTKQLANILIKILGLSVVVHSIPTILAGLFTGFQIRGGAPNIYWLYALTNLILPAVGVYLVLKSRDVTAFLFKDEEE